MNGNGPWIGRIILSYYSRIFQMLAGISCEFPKYAFLPCNRIPSSIPILVHAFIKTQGTNEQASEFLWEREYLMAQFYPLFTYNATWENMEENRH